MGETTINKSQLNYQFLFAHSAYVTLGNDFIIFIIFKFIAEDV